MVNTIERMAALGYHPFFSAPLTEPSHWITPTGEKITVVDLVEEVERLSTICALLEIERDKARSEADQLLTELHERSAPCI